MVHVFEVGHYNHRMLSIARILVTGHVLAACAAMLAGCGQKGALYLPNTPESQGRATLPQTLNPWHKVPAASSTAPAPSSAPSSAASEPAR
jgi:predicted small lipoprotein YifL